MSPRDIEINPNSVVICGITAPRPERISVTQWMTFWETMIKRYCSR